MEMNEANICVPLCFVDHLFASTSPFTVSTTSSLSIYLSIDRLIDMYVCQPPNYFQFSYVEPLIYIYRNENENHTHTITNNKNEQQPT